MASERVLSVEGLERGVAGEHALRSRSHVRRGALLICGTLSLALGMIGIFVPLLPTTCFLLLAAWCYARSSPRLYDRLLRARWIGDYLRRYRDERQNLCGCFHAPDLESARQYCRKHRDHRGRHPHA